MRAVFHEVGWSEINGDFSVGEGKTGICEGAFDAVAGFGNDFISHAYDIKSREAFVHVAFDFYYAPFVAIGDSGKGFCYHVLRIR